MSSCVMYRPRSLKSSLMTPLSNFHFPCMQDVSNVASFQLPDPAGRAGGACTSAMLKILYADHKKTSEDKSFQEVLLEMRSILKSSGYSQIPQLSSSRPLDVHTTFDLVPNDVTGTKRAVMIGINYVGT